MCTEERFLTNPSIKDDLIDAVNDLPPQSFVLDFDETNEAHVEWAFLAWESDFWAPYSEGPYECGHEVGSVEFAIALAKNEMKKVKTELIDDGIIDEHWSGDKCVWQCTINTISCAHK